MTQHRPDTEQLQSLRSRVTDLERVVREAEIERDRLVRRRRRHMLLMGGALSLLAHITIMIILSNVVFSRGGGGSPQPSVVEFAILNEQELTELETADFSDLVPDVISEFDEVLADEAAADLSADMPAPELEISRSGAVPTLDGTGEGLGDGEGLAGGGAGTSFFGVASKGTRFAFIVDISGSMGQDNKLPTAMHELARAVQALPDYAYFYVVLYSSNYQEPPMQQGWTRARRGSVRTFVRWLESVSSGGGTQPRTAFHRVFDLETKPDVIYFLTDGLITGFSAEEVRELNAHGRLAVINTIAFGDPSSQELLRRIAGDSKGVYRFAPSR